MNFDTVEELKAFLVGKCEAYQLNASSTYECAVEHIWKAVPLPYENDKNDYLTHVRWDINHPDSITLVTAQITIPVHNYDGFYYKKHSTKELVIIPKIDIDPYVFHLEN